MVIIIAEFMTIYDIFLLQHKYISICIAWKLPACRRHNLFIAKMEHSMLTDFNLAALSNFFPNNSLHAGSAGFFQNSF